MKIIDMAGWERSASFDFFKAYEYPQFNICAQIEITKTYEYLLTERISKFNAFLWLICKAANSVREIRYRIRENTVVEHERLDPSFTVLTEDQTLAFCLAEYTDDVSEFFERVNLGISKSKANPTIADEPGVDNLIYVSCVPWINFTSISHPVKMDKNDCIPRISWGKFTTHDKVVFMPVSLQLHHGLADGYHAGCFFQCLESLLEQPDAINWPL